MYLKQIDILGFKSFADKTQMVLGPGITAIVGPNGSGKSNIADALRWVLGEQSVRNLRGSKMEDVIFAGSEMRKATNLCEVSITLDNTDHHLPVTFEEVTITRRAFRSGESEYWINRQPCRLKDIHELFMDTGLGREAYSIIGQGKIEEMLSTRPEDRRGPFEDAAGIVKFKHRRKEAERRLEETAANLVRVDDILAELEAQLGPLAEARRVAERYQALSDEIEETEIALLVVEIDRLHDRYEQLKRQVHREEEVRGEALEALRLAEEAWKARRQALHEASANLEALQAQYVQLVEARQKAQGSLALSEERLAALAQRAEDRQRRKEEVSRDLAEIEAAMQALAQAEAEAAAALGERQQRLEHARARADDARRLELAEEIDRLSGELIDANQRAAALRNELKTLEERVQAGAVRHERFEEEARRIRAERERIEAACRERSARAEVLRRELEEMEAAFAALDLARERAAADEAQAVAAWHRLQADVQGLSSRLELLRDLEAGYDGYAHGVRTVLQQAKRGALKGVWGSVAEIVRVDRAHELAIETALGGALQNVIVETEQDAKDAIRLLKARQGGRATFIPLDVVRSRRMEAGLLARASQEPGFLGLASDLVSFDERFRHAVEHLLGNVVIAQDLDCASRIARALNHRFRVVTLEGDVIAPGGLMTGGHVNRRGPGLIGRQREREELEQKLQALEAERQRLNARQSELREQVVELGRQREALEAERASRLNELKQFEDENKQAAYALKALDERLEALEWERESLTQDRSQVERRLADVRGLVADAEREVARLTAAIGDRRERLVSLESELAEAKERLTGLRIEVATLEQERKNLSERMADLRERKARLVRAHAEMEREAARDAEESARLLSARESERAEAARLAEDMDALEQALASARQARHELEAEVHELEEGVRRSRRAVEERESVLQRALVAVERADAELSHALAKMGEQFGMTYEWAKTRYPLQGSVAETERKLEALRRERASLGDVNLGAIEEHERLSERVRFLTEQRDDLVAARAQLEQLIDEIDHEMATRFMETFQQIRSEFGKAFHSLFQGGEADLVLTDPSDPLTTGIEVVAKPPGKKLQNLNLLSGGERALTAMALLFAILRVRPVPFCVLDEVEAALDEANVARFAHELRLLAADTQFIVITHRRGTMEEADALYGVTMPERGVSSLVSVRLTDEIDYETA
ncbi:chromosome segregation protein SMC [Alicyclobacillus vulcanalis]|uniref:Chromosome partition protein Smc n=1 Tax=Alicyclobacillus vulcanalis TaxID=252246 RepID=A0A1N7NS70_9BACL|nr:chromosome segregation protein SMC [Alicyclobacillus vulcanalis]SIT01213.1 condensin subunit Smc [Alicyclobacillus vulcanalis]